MKKGFTLIELLIVIAIIAILAAILFVSIGTQPLLRSRDAKRVSDLQNLRTALAIYYTDNNRYPATTEFGAAGTIPFVPGYAPALPRDPSANANALNATNCAGFTPTFGHDGTPAITEYGYSYAATGTTPQRYVLTACLESNTNVALASDCDDTVTTPACFDDGDGAGSGTTLYDIAT